MTVAAMTQQVTLAGLLRTPGATAELMSRLPRWSRPGGPRARGAGAAPQRAEDALDGVQTLFSPFEKRFTRQGGAVIGYNQSVRQRRPAGWPAVQRNDRGLGWEVFRHLHDFCRRVSTGRVIGAFLLARKP